MNSAKTLYRALRLVQQCDAKAFWLKLLYVALGSLLPLTNLWLLKLLIDEVVRLMAVENTIGATYMPIATYTLLFCGVFFLNRVVAVLEGVNNDLLTQKLIDYISDRIHTQSATLDMAYYDNPTYHDTFHRAQQEASFRPIQILNHSMTLIGSLISIVGITLLMVSASWLIIVIMIVAVVPSLVVRIVKARSIYAFRRDHTQDYRRTNYFSSLLTHRNFAKEVRVFGLVSYFRERYVKQRQRLVKSLLHISKRIAVWDLLCAVIETVALWGVFVLLLSRCVGGLLTVGAFVMLFEAFRRGQGYLQSLVGSVAGLYDSRLFVGNLFEFLELKPAIVSPCKGEAFPSVVERIDFQNVTFRYPDMDHDVLHNFNLTAHRGNITRIEGENGYGKTTLVKLLLRLYDPNEGSVRVNGIDIRRFAIDDLRKGVGVIFQDYVQFQCSVEENIAFGNIATMQNPDRHNKVIEAATMAGADSVVDRLSQGYGTLLGRMFDNGSELSTGQWQRIALARLFYAQSPVMVLDEPTSWMDKATRSHFYATLEQLKENHLIIMISHI